MCSDIPCEVSSLLSLVTPLLSPRFSLNTLGQEDAKIELPSLQENVSLQEVSSSSEVKCDL